MSVDSPSPSTRSSVPSPTLSPLPLTHEQGPMSGPVLGSIIGNYLVLAGWQWTFRFMTILVGINTVAVIVFMDETYAPYVLLLS